MKHKQLSRILSLLLTFALFAGMLPASAQAKEGSHLMVPSNVSSDKSEETIPFEKPLEEESTVSLAEAGTWKIQDWGKNEDVPVQEGWLTAETDDGFTLDYTKIIENRGKEGLVIYDSAAGNYKDSTLTLDFTLSDPADGQGDFYSLAILPRFESGKNCEGLGIHDKGHLEHAAQKNGTENRSDWVRNDAGDFLYGKTYSIKLVTEGNNITVSAAEKGSALVEVASFDTMTDVAASGYGFRIWRGGKTIKVENIVRTELVSTESSLGETEKTIPYADWGKVGAVIPVIYAVGDEVTTIKDDRNTELTAGSHYSLKADNSTIELSADYTKSRTDVDTITLTINFKDSSAATYKLFRGEAPLENVGGWVVQKQGGNTNITIRDGWITATENSVIIDYDKIIKTTGEGLVIFNDTAPKYIDSTLEYDITFTNGTQAPWIAVAPATRAIDGKNYEGFAIPKEKDLERTGRKDGSESYGGISNLSGTNFEYNKTYHLRMVTVGSNITVYVKQGAGEEQQLTAFESPIGLGASGYGFRIWRGGKTIKIENIVRTEIITSGLEENVVRVDADKWGTEDVLIPVRLGAGDSVASIKNGETPLTQDTDFTVDASNITLKQTYFAAHGDTFPLTVTFAKGSVSELWVTKYNPNVRQEYTWEAEDGVAMWSKIGTSGTFAMNDDNTAMRVTGKTALLNASAPITDNGEMEITFEALRDQDGFDMGALFRADAAKGSWQALASTDSINGEGVWDFLSSAGGSNRYVWDATQNMSRDGVSDLKIKVRYIEDSLTLWIDDQFAYTTTITQARAAMGGMGLYVDNNGDVLIKKVVFREIKPMVEAEGERTTKTIANGGLTVQLDQDFPRVVDYTLNDKKMNGSELRYNYVTINTVDYPATATVTASDATSVTYAVTPDPEKTGVTFNVTFTVMADHILEMLITNIVEPAGEKVYSIGFPNQPLISANSTQTGAALDASYVNKNARHFVDVHEDITKKNTSTVAPRSVTIPVVTADGLSASMHNNVYIGGDEFTYKAFELPGGEMTAGFWNTDFMYRGVDGEKILPFPSEPGEAELYCRVIITEDTNGDEIVNWQDGANALKTLNRHLIPGGDQAARSFFHVGYNFSSGAQQPFLKVADNMKRLSNSIDGFSQQLIFKGYGNEGHDSGHADYQDINRRAGGAEDMRIAIAEADKLHSNMGIHINSQEAYPEAKMFNDHVMGDRDGWYWMDHGKILRRYVDMLEGGFQERIGLLYDQTPDLDLVYVDCWGEDRWGEKVLIGTLLENGAELFANENAPDFTRFGVWVHSTSGNNNSPIHQFVFNTQKDIYPGNGIYWGGYSRAASMMSWQHNNNINGLIEQFYTNQLPQKYLMCHEVERVADGTGYFSDNITSKDYVITKDGNKMTDGGGKIFIPWYAEDSETKNPDEAAKIYHWNSNGGDTTWTLPLSWQQKGLTTVKLYKNTQAGRVFVKDIDVVENKVTINADSKTPYVVYPGEAAAKTTDWSVNSPIKDTGFNTRDFSVWEKSGEANMHFNDDGNGVSILTIEGTAAGQVSQTMTGLEIGQKYRVKVDAGAENGKTARITVETPDGKTVENYLEQIKMNNQYFDDYAKGKPVQRMWVDFVATAETATLTLSADACEAENGKVTFMENRIVKTAEPDLPKGYIANETFEFVEQGAYGIFNPESSQDGAPHLSETHLPYTSDTINGDWSLKVVGARGQSTTVRTSPATMRMAPNTAYNMQFETQGGGTVFVQSEADGSDKPLEQRFVNGHNEFNFTTGAKTDYIVRIESGARVIDDFKVYSADDPTPPTAPTNVTATAVQNGNSVKLDWTAATDDDGQIGGYRIYRGGELLKTIGNVTTYTDVATADETAYTYQVSAVNGGATEGAKSAVASVTTGVLMPTVLSAAMTSGSSAVVTFNKPMEKASAETIANYTVGGDSVTVSAAILSVDGKNVTLTLAGLSVTDIITLQVVNVKDASGKHTIAQSDLFTLGMLHHYYKFNEAADAAATDERGNQNGVKNNVTSVAGKEGQAMSVAGDGYVDVKSRVLSEEEAFTISTWVKWAGGTTKDSCILSNDVSGDASSRGLTFKVSDGKFKVTSNVGGIQSEAAVTPNEWVHLALVKDAKNASLYVNGAEVITTANPFNLLGQNADIRIGGNTGGGGSLVHPFSGAIDEVKIFTAALSETDVAELAGKTMAPTPTATFDTATMTLSNVTTGMKYSVDAGTTWVEITGTTVNLSDAVVTVSSGIQVKQLGNGNTTVDSKVQTITLTQAVAPTTVGKTDCTTAANNDGTLTGVTTAMEYKGGTIESWTACTGITVTGLTPAAYEIRIASKGTVLAGESVTVTVSAYTPATIAVTGVIMNKSTLELAVNGSETLTYTITPEDATDKSVIWESSAPAVATVENGKVTAIKAGTTTITVKTVDGEFTDTCAVTVKDDEPPYVPPYNPPANNTDKETIKNDDGSTTVKITDKKTGTITETTKRPDGSQTVVETKKDGTVSTTHTRKDGVKTDTVTTPEGNTTATVTVPKDTEKVTVTIPTPEKPGGGTVAVIINADGTKTVVKNSVATEEGMTITLAEGAKLEIIDNSKAFADVASGEWYADAVQFVASRELFQGVGGDRFEAAAPMNRAMLMTVLYRLEGASVESGGDTWYADAQQWAVDAGITDGTNPDAQITREQLATILFRYAKGEAATADMGGFGDADGISDYAKEAMTWAVANNILQGSGNNLNPQNNATRGEVAIMLQRFVELGRK